MIRPATEADTPYLLELTYNTGVFRPQEIDALKEVLDDYHAGNKDLGHQAVTCEDKGEILGYAYYAPAAMTDRTWYLYWIAVSKQNHARGIGSTLLKYLEEDIQARNGRILFIETSSLPNYDLTRLFYERKGYDKEATLRDYYKEGDHMVVYRKLLEGE